MKFKLSTYLFAAGAMAGTFIAINAPASAHEHAHKAGAQSMTCCMENSKAKSSVAKTSAKKTSAPMACCQKAGAKTAKVMTKASAKMTSTKGAMKCCAQAGKKL